MYYLKGYHIFANYNLKGIKYSTINSLNDFKKVKTPKNFLAADELWLSMDSRRSAANILAGRNMMLSRKIKLDCMYTVQDLGQADKRLRQNTHIVYEPQILATLTNGKPILLNVTWYTMHQPNKIKRMRIPLIMGEIDICELYDTFEIIDEFEDTTRQDRRLDLATKYKNHPAETPAKLAPVIAVKEDLTTAEANLIARFIFEELK